MQITMYKVRYFFNLRKTLLFSQLLCIFLKTSHNVHSSKLVVLSVHWVNSNISVTFDPGYVLWHCRHIQSGDLDGYSGIETAA